MERGESSTRIVVAIRDPIPAGATLRPEHDPSVRCSRYNPVEELASEGRVRRVRCFDESDALGLVVWLRRCELACGAGGAVAGVGGCAAAGG